MDKRYIVCFGEQASRVRKAFYTPYHEDVNRRLIETGTQFIEVPLILVENNQGIIPFSPFSCLTNLPIVNTNS